MQYCLLNKVGIRCRVVNCVDNGWCHRTSLFTVFLTQCNDDNNNEDNNGEYDEPHYKTNDDLVRQDTLVAVTVIVRTCSRIQIISSCTWNKEFVCKIIHECRLVGVRRLIKSNEKN